MSIAHLPRDVLLDEVILAGPTRRPPALEGFTIVEATTPGQIAAYHRLRHEVFVVEQGLFAHSDIDEVDADIRTRVLLAVDDAGELLGGVRIHPMHKPDLGWWRGGRLAVDSRSRMLLGVGAALIRAACAAVEDAGALRFDATIQEQNERLFKRLGWVPRERLIELHGMPHVVVEWPIQRVAGLVAATKAELAGLLASTLPNDAWLGDDGAPVAGTDVIVATDAILPTMVERDPEWAGWCSVLVNVNDLCAMGATPVGLMDALGARDVSFARRVLRGMNDAARAWGVPVLGGHTQLGVHGSLAVTALGRTTHPVPGGGASPGEVLRLTADVGGAWRPGYTGRQWDSTSHRTPAELQSQATVVPRLAPTAAKDVSMAGLAGTAGMLAEASGCRVVIDVASLPRPDGVTLGDWLTCFPGFAMVTTEVAGAPAVDLPPHLTSAVCGELLPGSGVALRWPDGTLTDVADTVTGLGAAAPTF